MVTTTALTASSFGIASTHRQAFAHARAGPMALGMRDSEWRERRCINGFREQSEAAA